MKLTPQQKRNLWKNTKDKPTGIHRDRINKLLDKIIVSSPDGAKWEVVRQNAFTYKTFINS